MSFRLFFISLRKGNFIDRSIYSYGHVYTATKIHEIWSNSLKQTGLFYNSVRQQGRIWFAFQEARWWLTANVQTWLDIKFDVCTNDVASFMSLCHKINIFITFHVTDDVNK
jgi:hypothetical protein